MAAIFFIMSAILVDLMGYWLHRWLHRPSSGRMHDAHMTHHVTNYPPRAFFSERYRSSRGDSLVLWFAPFGAIYAAAVLLSGCPHPIAVLTGGALVAIGSSSLHDLTHISRSIVWRVPFLRGVCERHRVHHSKMGRNFGILVGWWDRIFGTAAISSRSHSR